LAETEPVRGVERERAEDSAGREKSEERLGEMDRVYGAGMGQKGEERTPKSEDRTQNSQFRTQKEKASE